MTLPDLPDSPPDPQRPTGSSAAARRFSSGFRACATQPSQAAGIVATGGLSTSVGLEAAARRATADAIDGLSGAPDLVAVFVSTGSAGEIGPVGGRAWLHGFTASVLAFP